MKELVKGVRILHISGPQYDWVASIELLNHTKKKASNIDADVSKDIRIKRMDHKVYKYTCFYTLKRRKTKKDQNNNRNKKFEIKFNIFK